MASLCGRSLRQLRPIRINDDLPNPFSSILSPPYVDLEFVRNVIYWFLWTDNANLRSASYACVMPVTSTKLKTANLTSASMSLSSGAHLRSAYRAP